MSNGGSGRVHRNIERPAHHADLERMAAMWEEAVLPQWERPLVRPLVEATALPQEGSVLIAECRTGFAVEEVARRVPEAVRCIAIEPSREMLDVARARRSLGERRVWWDARAVGRLPYQAGVFDAAICASGVETREELRAVGGELARVTRAGGAVSLLVPLGGSFGAFYDMFREALWALGAEAEEARLDAFLDTLPSLEALQAELLGTGLKEVEVHAGTLPLRFGSGEGFLFHPVVAALFFPRWWSICPDGALRDQVFVQLAQGLDTWFHGLDLTLEAQVAWAIGRV
jgi:SAM-dependent methyltransferase